MILFPELPFRWAGLEKLIQPQTWRCVSMIFSPLGFLHYAMRGDLPGIAGWTIVTNDLVRWIPIELILRSAYASQPVFTK